MQASKSWRKFLASMLIFALISTNAVTVFAKDGEDDNDSDQAEMDDSGRDSDDDLDDSDDEDETDDSGMDSESDLDDSDEDYEDDEMDDDQKRTYVMPHVFEQRHRSQFLVIWGNVTDPALVDDPARDAVSETSSTIKEEAVTDWSGSLSADDAEVRIKKALRFEEKEDSYDEDKLTFVSKIHGGVDALLIDVKSAKKDESTEVDPTQMGILNLNFAKTGEINVDLYELREEGYYYYDAGDGYGLVIKPVGHDAKGEEGHMLKERLKEKVEGRHGKHKENLQEKLAVLKANAGALAESCKALYTELESYNSVTDPDFDAFLAELKESSDAAICLKAKSKFEEKIKPKQRQLKFEEGFIPFKDVDDSEWFFEFADKGKKLGVFTGFMDGEGKLTGEFRPALEVRLGEVIKVAALLAKKADVDGEPLNKEARKEWFSKYVKAAEDAELTIAKDTARDFRSPATRSDVVRIFLEFLGVEIPADTACEYSDLPATHANYAAVCYATELGIVSGDEGKTTFRPDATLSRAEFAKIYVKFKEAFVDAEEEVEEVLTEIE